jgi:type I restriction enzyme M protein
MGSLFEELIRKFAEQSNETAGEHFTPREVIKLMVEILFDPDRETLKKPHIIKTIYDCASGTGGMLTVSKDLIREKINPDADIFLFGQELNPATYAICKSDMLIKGEDPDRIKGGEKDHTKASTLSNDQFWGQEFDYLITNPPFGVDWKKDKSAVEREAARGYAGRFGAGLPRISDGQLLFLQHLLFKMRSEKDGGSRVAIVFNGSPLFTGDAGGGESEIRRWILEHDWLEAIVALPDQLFYNTGISTYIWFLSNRKSSERRGRVQLIDARSMYGKMRKSLGNKRNEITDANRAQVVDIYRSFQESEFSKIFTTTDFAYRQIVVERPLRLNFQASRERLERLKNRLDLWPDTHVLDGINKDLEEEISPGLKKALLEPVKKGLVEAEDLKRKMCSALDSIGDELYRSQRKFEKAFDEKWEAVGFKPGKAIRKVMLEALSERDPQADICLDVHGNPEPDSNLRDTENVPWGEDVREYFTREVLPFVPDAWINESVRDEKDGELGRVGYEIPLTRYFYTYQPPRPLEAIESDIANVEGELAELLKKL